MIKSSLRRLGLQYENIPFKAGFRSGDVWSRMEFRFTYFLLKWDPQEYLRLCCKMRKSPSTKGTITFARSNLFSFSFLKMDSFICFFLSVDISNILTRSFRKIWIFNKWILKQKKKERKDFDGSEENRLLACTFVCLTKPHEIGDFGIILFSWP